MEAHANANVFGIIAGCGTQIAGQDVDKSMRCGTLLHECSSFVCKEIAFLNE